jgi:hypothetical protein
MTKKIDDKIRVIAEEAIAAGKNKRAIAVLKALLDKGSITTDDLNDLGYNHPPRAVGDVRDLGIPIITGSVTSERTGRRMAVYTFGDPSQIQDGRIGGRSALPKKFKTALINRYGSIDCITGAKLDETVLQIDHRIPYRVAGDLGLKDHEVESYMLLDASSQRAKSWSCEHCPNLLGAKDFDVCATCYWAFPEKYLHIATEQIRRIDLVWQSSEVKNFDLLSEQAKAEGVTLAEKIKAIIGQSAKTS